MKESRKLEHETKLTEKNESIYDILLASASKASKNVESEKSVGRGA